MASRRPPAATPGQRDHVAPGARCASAPDPPALQRAAEPCSQPCGRAARWCRHAAPARAARSGSSSSSSVAVAPGRFEPGGRGTLGVDHSLARQRRGSAAPATAPADSTAPASTAPHLGKPCRTRDWASCSRVTGEWTSASNRRRRLVCRDDARWLQGRAAQGVACPPATRTTGQTAGLAPQRSRAAVAGFGTQPSARFGPALSCQVCCGASPANGWHPAAATGRVRQRRAPGQASRAARLSCSRAALQRLRQPQRHAAEGAVQHGGRCLGCQKSGSGPAPDGGCRHSVQLPVLVAAPAVVGKAPAPAGCPAAAPAATGTLHQGQVALVSPAPWLVHVQFRSPSWASRPSSSPRQGLTPAFRLPKLPAGWRRLRSGLLLLQAQGGPWPRGSTSAVGLSDRLCNPKAPAPPWAGARRLLLGPDLAIAQNRQASTPDRNRTQHLTRSLLAISITFIIFNSSRVEFNYFLRLHFRHLKIGIMRTDPIYSLHRAARVAAAPCCSM